MSDEETPQGRDDTQSGSEDAGQPGISDEELPDDVRPGDDNPLAYGPSDDDDEDEGMSLGGDDDMGQPG